MGLHLDIHLDDFFGNGHNEVEPLPHDSLLYAPPPEDHPPVASRDDDKGAPTNEKDDDDQDDNANIPWIRLFELIQVDDFFRHAFLLLGVLTEMMRTTLANEPISKILGPFSLSSGQKTRPSSRTHSAH